MTLALSLKYGVWYSIYSAVVKYSKVTVMVGQDRYSKMRMPSQLNTLKITNEFGLRRVICFISE